MATMTDIITYVASSGDYAFFGAAEDPVAQVAAMQDGSPYPIKILAGWIVPPRERGEVMASVKNALQKEPRRGEWFKIPGSRARKLLALHAGRASTPWEVRKRTNGKDHPQARAVVAPHGRFPSAGAAGAAIGISRQAAWELASRRSRGWRFEDDTSEPPPPAKMGRPRKDSPPTPR